VGPSGLPPAADRIDVCRLDGQTLPGVVMIARSVIGRLVFALGVFSPAALVMAQDVAADGETPWFSQAVDTEKFAVIITGAAATPESREQFRSWTADLYQSLRDDYGYPDSHTTLLMDDGNNVGELAPMVDGSSELEDIRSALDQLSQQMAQGDQLTLFLIGHGSSRFGEAKFNNVGPDMTGSDLAQMLEAFDGQDIVVVNTTSASFEFSRELAANGRVIVSATRSAAERYDPVFGGFFIEAMQGRQADLDRNGRLSILEAFNFASSQTAEWYSEQGRLPTENAVLDDTGDGLFSREPGRNESDGLLAEIAYVDIVRPDEAKTSPGAREILADIQRLEREIFILRNQKSNYLEEDYWSRLEALLIDLALQTRDYNALP